MIAQDIEKILLSEEENKCTCKNTCDGSNICDHNIFGQYISEQKLQESGCGDEGCRVAISLCVLWRFASQLCQGDEFV